MKGELIHNKYIIIKILGKSLFSETYLAKEKNIFSCRRYVIKKFRPILGDPQVRAFRNLFEREASVLRLLSGNNNQIPQLYEYYRNGEEFYLVREWIKGITLEQKVQQEGKLTESNVKQILHSILSVLKYIHQYGIVYRELSPTSVVLRPQTWLAFSGKKEYLPVPIYFGRVKELEAKTNKPESHNLVLANHNEYISPEKEPEISSFAGDIYSLGLTAIYLLTAKTPAELNVNPYNNRLLWQSECLNISTNLARAINRAISPNLTERFAGAEEMLRALFPRSIHISETAMSQQQLRSSSWLTPEIKIVSMLSSLGLGIVGTTFATLNFDFSSIIENQSDRQSLSNVNLDSFSSDLKETTNYEPKPQLNIPAFRVGVPLEEVKNYLGKPTYESKGYWSNSRAFLYKNFLPEVDLGYLSDIKTKTIYQTEISFDESVEGIEIEHTLKKLLMTEYSTEIDNKVEEVIDNKSDKQQFRTSNLEGLIQRNAQKRIYLAIWKSDFHQ